MVSPLMTLIPSTLLVNAGAILNFKFGNQQILPLDETPTTMEEKPSLMKSFLNDLKTLRVFIALWNIVLLFLMLILFGN
jgi:hypothetical protein